MPAYRVKLRRGTSAEHANFVGAEGEVTVDTDKKRLVVHDGVTPGGFLIAALEDVKTDISEYTDSEGLMGGYTYDVQGTELPLTSTSPIVNYTVTVASGFRYNGRGIPGGPGNVFYLRNDTAGHTEFTENPHITLQTGYTYIFDMSDASNIGHPLQFTTDMGQTAFTSGVTTLGTAGQAGATVTFTVPSPRPLNLMYYCGAHGAGMGGEITIGSDAYVAPSEGPTGIAYGGTRGILSGDWATEAKAEIDYFDIQTAGSSASFGSLNTPRSTHGSVSNGSRACFMGGSTANYGGSAGRITDIEYVTPATPGNGTSMGDLNSAVMYITSSALTEGTYGYCPGGGDSSSLLSNIDVFSIDNGGTATTYGNLLAGKSDATGISNATQGIVLGGYLGGGSTYTNAIEYFAFGTTGQVYDFGDIDTGTRADSGAAANSTLGIFAGGIGSTSSIDYISLASPGNSAGVGTLTAGMNPCGAATDGTLAAFVALSGSVVVNTINIDTQGTATNWGSIPTGTGGNRFQFGSCTSGNAA